jgi:plasmid stabilization system protein ParE
VRDIGDFIARDKPEAAKRWASRVMDAVGRLAQFLGSGRTVPEIGRDDLREIILGGYRIVYQIRGEAIIILTVFEGHMRLDPEAVDDDAPE